MANHSFFIRICDSARFQIPHRGEGVVDLRLHLAEKIIRKLHSTDVDRKTEIVVAQKILLEPLPERRARHRGQFMEGRALCRLKFQFPGGLFDFCSAPSFLTGTSSFGATSYSGFGTPSSQ